MNCALFLLRAGSAEGGRMDRLERRVAVLEAEVAELKQGLKTAAGA